MAGYSVTFSVVDEATDQIEKINRRIRQMREPIERMSRQVHKFVDLSGLKKVGEGFTEITRRARESLEVISRLVPVMGTLTGAASIAGMFELTRSWAEFGNQLIADATRIGETAGNLEEMQTAIELAGGSTNDMTESLKGLTQAAYGAFTGRDPTAVAWFRKAGINIRDANGHLKTATQLLPEVTRYIEGLKDPTDRLTAAQGLGSAALARLAEELQRSGKTLPQWLAEAAKIPRMTDEQAKALTRYNQAIGKLDAAFSSLKNQIGATLAEAFTPLINTFADFVQKHEPEIIAKIRELAQAFANWIKSIDWKSVQQGFENVGKAVVFLTDHINLLKTTGEVVLGFYALKWSVGMVTTIATVVRAIGSVGAIAAGTTAGGLGLLGALGAGAALTLLIIQHWKDFEQIGKELFKSLGDAVDRLKKSLQEFWSGTGKAVAPYSNLPPNAGPPRPAAVPGFTPGGAWAPPPAAAPAAPAAPAPPAAPAAPMWRRGGPGRGPTPWHQAPVPDITGMTDIERNQLALIEHYESHGRNVPNYRFDPTHTAQGYWQETNTNWRAIAPLLGITAPDAMHATREEQAMVALALLRNRQGIRNWSDYDAPLRAALARGEQAPAALLAGIPQGAPRQVAGGPPVSGSVDVTVTHRNPPAGATIAATGTGDVNIAQPRVEYAQLAVV
jgi:hypothetical protein